MQESDCKPEIMALKERTLTKHKTGTWIPFSHLERNKNKLLYKICSTLVQRGIVIRLIGPRANPPVTEYNICVCVRSSTKKSSTTILLNIVIGINEHDVFAL